MARVTSRLLASLEIYTSRHFNSTWTSLTDTLRYLSSNRNLQQKIITVFPLELQFYLIDEVKSSKVDEPSDALRPEHAESAK